MKKVSLIALLAAASLLLSGCGRVDKYPQVKLLPTNWLFDQVVLPLKDGYDFAMDMYSIVETEHGYDIVVHIEKGE